MCSQFVEYFSTSITYKYSQPQNSLWEVGGAVPPVLAFSLRVWGLVSREYDVLVFSV